MSKPASLGSKILFMPKVIVPLWYHKTLKKIKIEPALFKKIAKVATENSQKGKLVEFIITLKMNVV